MYEAIENSKGKKVVVCVSDFDFSNAILCIVNTHSSILLSIQYIVCGHLSCIQFSAAYLVFFPFSVVSHSIISTQKVHLHTLNYKFFRMIFTVKCNSNQIDDTNTWTFVQASKIKKNCCYDFFVWKKKYSHWIWFNYFFYSKIGTINYGL